MFSLSLCAVWPRRHRVVIFGVTGESLLRTYVSEEDVTVYVGPRTKLNLWVALLAFIMGWWGARGYYRSFLLFTRPKFVITFEDNALEFYLTKKYLSSCVTVSIQNGRRDTFSHSPSRNIWDFLSESVTPTSHPDVIATHGEPWSIYFRNALRSDRKLVAAIGSVKNNALLIGARQARVRILYVSTLPNLGADGKLEEKYSNILGYWRGQPVTFGDYYQFEGVVAQKCAEIASARGLQFGVLGKRPSWQKGEKSYFATALNNSDWFYQAAETEASSYTAVAETDLLVNIDSTFGYEMFARGVRVAFVAARMQYAGLHHIKDCEFGYPLITQPSGPFWTNQSTDQEITRVINFVIDADHQDWDSASLHLRETMMPFDDGNSQLCTLLDSLGIETRGPGKWDTDNIPKN